MEIMITSMRLVKDNDIVEEIKCNEVINLVVLEEFQKMLISKYECETIDLSYKQINKKNEKDSKISNI